MGRDDTDKREDGGILAITIRVADPNAKNGSYPISISAVTADFPPLARRIRAISELLPGNDLNDLFVLMVLPDSVLSSMGAVLLYGMDPLEAMEMHKDDKRRAEALKTLKAHGPWRHGPDPEGIVNMHVASTVFFNSRGGVGGIARNLAFIVERHMAAIADASPMSFHDIAIVRSEVPGDNGIDGIALSLPEIRARREAAVMSDGLPAPASKAQKRTL